MGISFSASIRNKILTQLSVVSIEMADASSSEDGEVLDLGTADGGAVVGDEDELGGSVSDGSQSKFVTYY